MGKEKKLFEGFPPVSKEEWIEVAKKDLKGKDFEKSLVWNTYEDFDVNPFYTTEDLKYLTDPALGYFPYLRTNKVDGSNWNICEEIAVKDVRKANLIAHNSLKGGADSLVFRCEYNESEIRGVSVQSLSDFEDLLRGVDIERAHISFIPGISGIEIISLFASFVKNQKFFQENIQGCLFFSPLNRLVTNGILPTVEKHLFKELGLMIPYLNDNMPSYKGFVVDGGSFKEAGSNVVQELAFSFSMGVEYLTGLISEGLKADDVLKQMFFSFSIDSNYFMEISKLRAARIVWAKIAEEFNPKNMESTRMTIHMRTSSWNKTIYDPHVNMLRTTLESMASAIGGSDYLTVTPFDKFFRETDDFSERIAKNTQLILREEAYLDKVADIAGGSYYIESLTDLIATNSLKLFQEVEAKGGFIECLKNSFIQDCIQEIANKKEKNAEFRNEIFLGTNQYPNLDESISEHIESIENITKLEETGRGLKKQFGSIDELINMVSDSGFKISSLINNRKEASSPKVNPIKPLRGARRFEEIRLATENFSKKSGSFPKVFLFTLGALNARRTRAAFATNFFGCAGYKIIDNIGFETVDEGVEKAVEKSADIVVICSSDEEYKELAPQVSKKIKGKMPNAAIVIAGYPSDIIEDLKKAGVDNFIHTGSNALEVLSNYQKRFKII